MNDSVISPAEDGRSARARHSSPAVPCRDARNADRSTARPAADRRRRGRRGPRRPRQAPRQAGPQHLRPGRAARRSWPARGSGTRCTRSSPTSSSARGRARRCSTCSAATTTARRLEKLIGVGIAAYAPTAVTGTIDWADGEAVDPRVRRAGLVHAASNATALGLYVASLAARRRGDHGRGKALGVAGRRRAGAGGFLGGHLSFARGVGRQPDRVRRGRRRLDRRDRRRRARSRASRSASSSATRRCCSSATPTAPRDPRPLLAPRLLAQRHGRGRRRDRHLQLPRVAVRPARRVRAARPGDDLPAGLRDARVGRAHRAAARTVGVEAVRRPPRRA